MEFGDIDTRLAAYAVITDSDRRVLLVPTAGRSAPAGDAEWTLPGGEIAFGETPFASLVRTTRESTGAEIRPVRLLGSDLLDTPAGIPENGPAAGFASSTVLKPCRWGRRASR